MTTSPADIKSLVQKVNNELEPITKKYSSQVPLADLSSVLTSNGLDPKAVQNGFQHNDEGRLHVEVGQGVYLTMTWYKFESTGRYEIVAYASSMHDDTKTPAKPMNPIEKRKAVAAVNKDLHTLGQPPYPKALGVACKTVSDSLERNGFDAQEFDHAAAFNTAGKSTGRIHVAIGNGMWLQFSFYRMEVTGNYEITAYVS
jgi:hypothetical protein